MFYGCFCELLPTIFNIRSDLQGLSQSVQVLEPCQRTCHLQVLWMFWWAISPSFGVLKRFQRIVTVADALWALSKNSLFSHFMAILWDIAHNFGVLVRYRRHMIVNAFLEPWPTTPRFCVLWPFLSAIDHNFGVLGRFTWHAPVDSFFGAVSKNWSFHIYNYSCELLPTILRFRCDLQGTWQSLQFFETWPKTHCLHILWPFL
jgi:hypothetical protein